MSRSMTRWTLVGCTALAALSAAAVLDAGVPTAEAAPSVSRFAGTYVWDRYSPPITINISDRGRIRAVAPDDIDGRVLADGSYSFTWTYYIRIYDDPESGTWRLRRVRHEYVGNMALDDVGNVVGTASTGDSFAWLRQ